MVIKKSMDVEDMAGKDVKRGIDYEKVKAKAHRAKHVGGPGKPDYKRGDVVGKVKNRKSKMTKPEVQKSCQNGVTEFESKGGYTKNAVDYVERYRPNIKLIQRGKKVNK